MSSSAKSREEYSGYAKEIFWVDQEELRTRQVQYENVRGEVFKHLNVSDYQVYAERFWKPGRMLMRNLRSGKSTELLWYDYRLWQRPKRRTRHERQQPAPCPLDVFASSLRWVC